MKAKYILVAAVLLGAIVVVLGAGRLPARMTFHVITDEGKPVAGATVGMSTYDHFIPGMGFGQEADTIVTGKTDSEGHVTLTEPCLDGEVAYGMRDMVGYYRSGGGKFKFSKKGIGRWEPWNPAAEIVFKPIGKPVPMYARMMGDLPRKLEIPELDNPVGFDLIAADWVAPYGKGKTSDFVFSMRQDIPYTKVEEPFHVTLTVLFSNKGDGIQSVLARVDEQSILRMPRNAPENGYEPVLVKHMGRPAVDKPIDSGTREDQNYFFRVRAVLDEKGNVVSATYGKIAHDINFWGNKHIRFIYYLNPTPNDRNMECDVTKNLFQDLDSLYKPTEP